MRRLPVGSAWQSRSDFAGGGASSSGCASPDEAFVSFCEAYDRLQREYVDDLYPSKLAEGAIKGMFQYGVEDPYSGYMPPEQYQQALGDLSGIEESPMGAALPDVARRCDWVIADENSNVHLPVLKLGIPTVVVKGLGLYPESRADMSLANPMPTPARRPPRFSEPGLLTVSL